MQTPTRERRKRHDGTEIDSVANLADFVQSFPASSGETEETPPPSTTATAAPPAAPTGYEGQTPEQIIAAATSEREKREAAELEAKNAREELQRGQRQREIEDTARRVVAEQQQQTRPAAPQAPPPPDPREEKIKELWWTDPDEARRLLNEVNDERFKAQLAASREETKREVFTELTQRQQQERAAEDRRVANAAFDSAMQKLRAAGVPESELNDRVRLVSVYSAITLKPTPEAPNPYYTEGGPMKADVIAKAWLDLTGRSSAAPAPAPHPVAQPQPPPTIIAPPGSSRPAPAAAPPGNTRAVPLSSDAQRDIAHMAEAFGYDKDKMLQRRRDRLAREKGN